MRVPRSGALGGLRPPRCTPPRCRWSHFTVTRRRRWSAIRHSLTPECRCVDAHALTQGGRGTPSCDAQLSWKDAFHDRGLGMGKREQRCVESGQGERRFMATSGGACQDPRPLPLPCRRRRRSRRRWAREPEERAWRAGRGPRGSVRPRRRGGQGGDGSRGGAQLLCAQQRGPVGALRAVRSAPRPATPATRGNPPTPHRTTPGAICACGRAGAGAWRRVS